MFYNLFLGFWNFPFLVGLIGIAVLYSYYIIRCTNIRLYHKQPLLFYLCLGLVSVTIGSPLASISHISFSLHMVQMSVHYFIVPPLLLLGIPNQVYQRISTFPITKSVHKCLSPKHALITFAILFLLYHLPAVLTIFYQHSIIHIGYTWLLFLLSFRMWWPIAVPDQNRDTKRFAYLSGILLMPACLLLIFNASINGINNPFLSQLTTQLCSPSQSSSFTLLPFPFNTKYDQVMAGVIMLGMHKFSIVLTFRLQNNI